MAMEVVKDDAMRLKRVISNHGLQVIQEINTMKGAQELHGAYCMACTAWCVYIMARYSMACCMACTA